MLRILGTVWRLWLKFAQILGTVQMTILLSLIYWTIFLIIAIPFKFLADPLSLRNPGRSRWVSRTPDPNILDSMRSQG